MSDPSPILVAVAWPYANGPLHLGHVAGSLLPPDVFARYQRLRGRRVIMVSGSDMHGTPITVAAEKVGEAPEVFAEKNRVLHNEALAALGIRFDLFTSTATKNHERVVHDLFLGLLKNGYIEKRPMTAPFDPKAKRFLPDRYVEGECPHCHFADARGDQCDNCGKTLDPQELLKPRSKLTGTAPEYRETEHYFLLLSKLQPKLEGWVREQAERAGWRPTVRNFTENWLKEGLKDRAITRDLTYGVTIPASVGSYPDKRIYVWFEAVVGYLSAPQEWSAQEGKPSAWHDYWLSKNSPKGYYFLGKDNIPFHTIIWPAMILGYNENRPEEEKLALPWDVPANEFLQFAGAKFSKSRGNAFYVLDLLKHFDADAARYYLTINMPERGDTDWTWPDFVAKTNDELVATLGNYANRVLAFCEKNYGGLPEASPGAVSAEEWARLGKPFEDAIHRTTREVAALLEAREFKKALRAVVALAGDGNRAVDAMAPWTLLKQGADGRAKAAEWLRLHLLAIREIAILLAPFLPNASEALWQQLGDARAGGPDSIRALAERAHPGEDAWPHERFPRLPPAGKLGVVKPLFTKLDLKAVLDEFGAAEAAAPAAQPKKQETTTVTQPTPAPAGATATQAAKATVTYDDFAKLDLRVGHVKSVEPHPKADKLYVLKVDLGTEERQILAGLREFVPAGELLGAKVIVIANLAPREIRGLKSEGMLLAAEMGGVVTPLRPTKDVPAGATIK